MSDSSKRLKSAVLRVRLTEEEQESFARFCAEAELTQSEAMRRLVRAATGLGPTFEGDARGEIVALTRQLRALGTNLNQAVRHMNAGHVITGSEVAEWLSAAQGLIKELTAHYDSLCARAQRRAARAVFGAAE